MSIQVDLTGNIYKLKKGFSYRSEYIMIIEDDGAKLKFLELETGDFNEVWYHQLVDQFVKVA